jgi:hypothetical protein
MFKNRAVVISLFCLFSSRLQSLTPKGYVDKRTDKGNRLPPLRASPNIRNTPPPACAVRKSWGMGPPYRLAANLGTKERKRLSTASRPLLLHLPNEPLIQGVGSRHTGALGAKPAIVIPPLPYPPKEDKTADRQCPVRIWAAVRAM